MSYGHYIRNMNKLTAKFTPENYDGPQQRLYAKDVDCPPVWKGKLAEIIPQCTWYLHPKADLMSSLPGPARAENMMCYIGHEGTYTPAHKEMCASLGQNIMVHTSSGAGKEPGSSIWFMTNSGDRELVAEYWLAHMGHDIEVEAHFASIADLQDAPFQVYIHEQKLGDYILVPPQAPHQVWNRGETTMKAAWNRTTVDTLERAVAESLPKARLVCRDEQYKNRAIIHETLRKYSNTMNGGVDRHSPGVEKIMNDFPRLFQLFHRLLLGECFASDRKQPIVEKIENEYNVQCSFCRANIWNRFLTCKTCVREAPDGDEDCYDICLDCYARGRSCYCVSNLDWVEQHDWMQLESQHEEFRQHVVRINSGVSTAAVPLRLHKALERFEAGGKTLAAVCQEQLAIRPWVDIQKNGLEDEVCSCPGSPEHVLTAQQEVDDEDTVQKKKRLGQSTVCHVCRVRHDTWKCAQCSTCAKAYCYGNLWRAFDMDPFDDVSSPSPLTNPHH